MSLFGARLNIHRRHTRPRQKEEAPTQAHRPEELRLWIFQTGLRQIKQEGAPVLADLGVNARLNISN